MRLAMEWFTFSCAAVVSSGHAAAQIQFTDVTSEVGLGSYHAAHGIAAGATAVDFDDDGDIDLFVPNGHGFGDQLYVNLGNGHFVERASPMGLDTTDNSRGALWFDHDGDGDLDLMVYADTYDGGPALASSSCRQYRNDGPAGFVEVTNTVGLGGLMYDAQDENNRKNHVGGAAAGDLNNDGHIDFVLGYWDGFLHLFLNDGAGSFVENSVPSGLQPANPPELEHHWQVVIHDFNGDGWNDIFSAVDFGPNQLWINQQDGTFTDVAAAAGIATAWNEMGVTIGDYDNDGDPDLYVTNIDGIAVGYTRHSVLFRNDSVGGVPSFTEVATSAGVAISDWGWGCTFFDADNDGWLDLASTNGFGSPPYNNDATHLFHNQGGPSPVFTDISATAGTADQDWGSCLLAFDFDRDGDLDMAQTTYDNVVRLYRNDTVGGGEHLVVQARMCGPNRFAIGATVRVQTSAGWLTRYIRAGTSMIGQEPYEASFGLGGDEVVKTLEILWPDGTQTVLTDITSDQVMRVTPSASSDVNGDGITDVDDMYAFTQTPVDLNCDGIADEDDRKIIERLVRIGEWVDRGGR